MEGSKSKNNKKKAIIISIVSIITMLIIGTYIYNKSNMSKEEKGSHMIYQVELESITMKVLKHLFKKQQDKQLKELLIILHLNYKVLLVMLAIPNPIIHLKILILIQIYILAL